MPITPDEFLPTNAFDAAFASALALQRETHGDGVPAYTADGAGLDDFAAPTAPISDYAWAGEHTPEARARQALVTAFHAAIAEKHTELVQTMVQRGFVSPDVPDERGSTPLCAAVRAENLLMAKLLLDLGADPNLISRGRAAFLPKWRRRRYGLTPPELARTPLMLAAGGGHLAMLRLLLDAGADDAAIAPDGQMALRLAADAGHRDIVDALPSRRGGAWRRWRHHNERSVYRARSAAEGVYYLAKFFVFDIPKFFLWTLPKWAGGKLLQGGKAAWGLTVELGRMLRRQIKLLPGRMKVAAGALVAAIKGLPGAIRRGAGRAARLLKDAAGAAWDVVKATPAFVAAQSKRAAAATVKAGRWAGAKLAAAPGALWRAGKATAKWAAEVVAALAKYLWGCLRRLPAALAAVGKWLAASAQRIGAALANVLAAPVALLHTAALAVVSALRRARNVTPRDLWNAFTALLRAVADLPRQIWGALVALNELTFTVLEKVFGFLGALVYGIVWVTVQGVLWVPKQIGIIVLAAGSSLRKGAHEVAVWINPKL
jgi:hypothetical protein